MHEEVFAVFSFSFDWGRAIYLDFKDCRLAGNKKCLFGFHWLARVSHSWLNSLNDADWQLEMEGDFKRRKCRSFF